MRRTTSASGSMSRPCPLPKLNARHGLGRKSPCQVSRKAFMLATGTLCWGDEGTTDWRAVA
eukprot:8516405-Prorocentrum_lima.AAC.1